MIKVIILGVCFLFVLGCSPQSQVEQPTTAPAGIVISATDDPVTVATINVAGGTFEPTNVEIQVGENLNWVNTDNKNHAIAFENGDGDFFLVAGGQASYSFAAPGEYRYFSIDQPGVVGTVVVR